MLEFEERRDTFLSVIFPETLYTPYRGCNSYFTYTYVRNVYVAHDSVALYIAVYPSSAVRRCSIIKCIAFLPFYLASRPPISGRVALWITALCPRDARIDAGLSKLISSFIENYRRDIKIFIHPHIFSILSFFFYFLLLCVSRQNIMRLPGQIYFIPITRKWFRSAREYRDVITIRKCNVIL